MFKSETKSLIIRKLSINIFMLYIDMKIWLNSFDSMIDISYSITYEIDLIIYDD